MSMVGNQMRWSDNPTYTATGNGSTTSYTLTWTPPTSTSLEVMVGGVEQTPQVDYSISGTAVIFNAAPANNASIFIRGLTNTGSSVTPAAGSVQDSSFASSVTGTGNIVRATSPTITTPTISGDTTISGNLASGGTLSSWGATFKTIQVNGSGSFSTGSGQTQIGDNFYHNGGFKYYSSAAASMIDFNGLAAGGGISFQRASSGTAGNAITWSESMRIDGSGNVNIGGTASYHNIIKSVTLNAGATVANISSQSTSGVTFCGTNGWNVNVANCTMQVGRDATTTRSINAGGTVNASGADYAEYEHNNGLTIQKGAIVGFKADGSLTLTFSEAIRFGIKSTNPSYVGGDSWASADDIGKRPQPPVDESDLEAVSAFESALSTFNALVEARRTQVDRIAYSGKVPVNVLGATAGGYIVADADTDGSIIGVFKADVTFDEYKKAVGRVNKILDDGRAEVAVIVH